MSGAATNGELSDDADEDVKKGEEGNEEDEEDGEESEDEYEVERILGMRVTKGKGRLFRVNILYVVWHFSTYWAQSYRFVGRAMILNTTRGSQRRTWLAPRVQWTSS